MKHRILALGAILIAHCATAPAISAETAQTSAGAVTVERVAGPFDQPWSIGFLPAGPPWNGAILVTEKPGTMRLVEGGSISPPVFGVPEVESGGQGGLLDVGVPPDFAQTGLIYLTYSEPDGFFSARTAFASARLEKTTRSARLRDFKVLFQQKPSLRSRRHYGSRIVFADDGTIFVTLGERGDAALSQNLSTHLGKVIRLNRDGSVPPDNPFVGQQGALPEIWSYGHRNPQGAAKRPSDGALFTVMHGARGGDEVNRPEAGKNYGWPEISYGTHYSGATVGRGFRAPGMEQPKHYWDPSIAPSGATFYDGDLFPQWKGNLFVGALKFQLISRLTVTDDEVVEVERLFERQFGRIRDVRTGPDGALWFAVDSPNGAIYRVIPAQ